MKAQDMVMGEIYEVRGSVLMVHDIKKCWYDKNGNAKTYTMENACGDFITMSLMNHIKVEEL